MSRIKMKIEDHSIVCTKGEVPEGSQERVDSTIKLMVEFLNMNNIGKSETLSAMASLIVLIMSQSSEKNRFYDLLKMMKKSFEAQGEKK